VVDIGEVTSLKIQREEYRKPENLLPPIRNIRDALCTSIKQPPEEKILLLDMYGFQPSCTSTAIYYASSEDYIVCRAFRELTLLHTSSLLACYQKM
jgi:hypothetical protein